jgi:hypothetical protein
MSTVHTYFLGFLYNDIKVIDLQFLLNLICRQFTHRFFLDISSTISNNIKVTPAIPFKYNTSIIYTWLLGFVFMDK